jgi:hypothetical protein
VHGGRDSVRGEDEPSARRDVVLARDEDRPSRLEISHDVSVVDDLPTDVDRGAETPQRLLDGLDCALHPRAVPAR